MEFNSSLERTKNFKLIMVGNCVWRRRVGCDFRPRGGGGDRRLWGDLRFCGEGGDRRLGVDLPPGGGDADGERPFTIVGSGDGDLSLILSN